MISITSNSSITSYPNSDDYFSPSESYPEYQWNKETISKVPNHVYDMIRNCFIQAGCDKGHIGSKEWNPLSEWILPGQTVLLKPNWVEHFNHNPKGSMECLVTHPAVVRAVVDYVAIALRGSGKIIIADAPMQGCNLPDLLEKSGYNKLFNFYKNVGLEIEAIDLRKYHVNTFSKGVISSPIMTNSGYGGIIVELGDKSQHSEKDSISPEYKVTDYLKEDTAKYHGGGHHCYEVSEVLLSADVIINMPKPKTHRLAGMTAGIKNYVGITHEKASLPHRIDASKDKNGDAYGKRSFFKEQMSRFDELRTKSSIENRPIAAKVYDFLMKVFYIIGRITSGDAYRIGSWYGNDTIWRTSVDLNHIVMNADGNGVLHDKTVRKVITIGDMIIAGQGDGPVAPYDKKLGMIVLSDNTYLFDRTLCEIMGFDAEKLPIFCSDKVSRIFGYDNTDAVMDEEIIVDGKRIKLCEFIPDQEWIFEPHSCWKGHIEKEL